MFNTFLGPVPKKPTPLEETTRWREAAHAWSANEMRALAVAGFSGRPLLVKGEPGVGKSQLARAAAQLLGWRFEYEAITPRFEPQDLLWRFDAVRRLADAGSQSLHADERAYATPGVLWRALDPYSAAQIPHDAGDDLRRHCVLLLDEIDKADSDLPNSLLEVLGNRSFKTPWATIPHDPRARQNGLLIVITSNDERELPLAFMRRCVVLDLKVPDTAQAFEQWLLERGEAQFGAMPEDIRKQAASMVWADRENSPLGQGARPGLAEYLDLLRALQEIVRASPTSLSARKAAAEQRRWLNELSPYVLRKQGQDQTPGRLPD
jgi:MoxR-like ATPase